MLPTHVPTRVRVLELAKPAGEMPTVPVETKPAAPVNSGLHESPSAEGDDDFCRIAHGVGTLAEPRFAVDANSIHDERGAKAVAPRVVRERHAEHAQETTMPTRGVRNAFHVDRVHFAKLNTRLLCSF